MAKMRRVKKLLVVILSLGMVVALTTAIPAGAVSENPGRKDVVDSEFVFCTLDWSGEIEEVQVFDILSLKGDGTFDVRKKKAFDEDVGWQGVKGFTKPKVEGDYLVWEGLRSEDNACYIGAAKFSEAMVEEAKARIPLDVRFKYRFDGVPVEDLDEITGKSGRFEMEVTFRNTSKEKTRVEYKDPDTGEMKEAEVETYLPLVIQPYDWYFDNRVFYNLEADPTGLVVPMPDFYNVGWSIPLFPPATGESHTIWVKADVKNFQMPPLTLAVAFVFPETNQENPTALFKAGLEQLYAGVKRINEGVGDPTKEDTLLYGITAIDEGLRKMADAQEGLPYAKTNIDAKMIPGVKEAAAGIGSEQTPETLLYAVAAVQKGLDSMRLGVNQMINGIGSATTQGTILNGLSQIMAGIQSMSSGLGEIGQTKTIIDGLHTIDQSIYNQIIPDVEDIKNRLSPGYGPDGVYDYVDTLINIDPNWPTQKATILGYLNSCASDLTGIISGLQLIHGGLSAPLPDGIIASLTLMKTMMDTQLIPGIQQIMGGLDNPTGVPQPGIKQGLEQIAKGIGDPGTYGTLLYAIAAMQRGLHQLKAGMSTGDPGNPGLLEGLQLLSAGLAHAVAGLGSSDTPDTLLYGTNAIKEGLTQVGGGTQQMVDGLYKNLVLLNTTEVELEAIAKRGAEFDHLLGRSEDATNRVRFVYQTKPTYNYKAGSKASWVTAIVLSVVLAILLVGGGIFLSRRAAA
ncbi:MAG: hypothetical protein ACUVRX_02315 [Actinomycetota bacterium]